MALNDVERFSNAPGLEQSIGLSEGRKQLLHGAAMASRAGAFHL
jgi:hypothetical protein